MSIQESIRAVALSRGSFGEAWKSGQVGLSCMQSVEAFRDILPMGAWDLKRPFRIVQLGGGKIRTEGVSTCGLVATRILHDAGIDLSAWVDKPYWKWEDPRHGKAMYTGLDVVSCLSLLSHRTGTRRAAGVYPQEGDVCCIGSGYATHILTVVSVDGRYVWSVDGGQVDKNGLQCIKLLRRQWWGTRVQWVMDSGALAAKLAP